MPQLDPSVLEMALVGYAEQSRKIETAIAEIRTQLGGRTTKAAAIMADGAKPKRRLSAAARKLIALAQKKRWAAFHKSKAANPAPAKKTAVKKAQPKRKLSPARKAGLVANLAKARAAKAAKKTTGESVPF
jgi:hypothetical protein